MPHKKKKFFTKNNSVKFLLVHGNNQAQNADGETLQNVLVPIDRNYKAGTSLLLSSISELCNSQDIEIEDIDGDANLKNILDQFQDDDDDDDELSLQSGINYLNISKNIKRSNSFKDDSSEENSDYYDVRSHFSDASDDEEEEDDDYDDMFKKVKLDSLEIPENCPENIQILNARFEKVLEEYDEDQIGALDDEEITGYLSTDCERVQNIFQEKLNPDEEIIELGACEENLKEKILDLADNSEEENIVEIVTEKPLEFDCESILSTYSNQYNHPTVIKEENKKVNPRNPLRKGLTKSQLKTLDENMNDDDSDDNVSVDSRFNIRNKGETPEERRERKSLFKEAKRESRMLKKENKLAFKEEKKKQVVHNLHVQRTKGIKLL